MEATRSTGSPAYGDLMKVIVFGASGMVGQGVLLECLRDDRVTEVVSVGRRPSARTHPKLTEVTIPDVTALDGYDAALGGATACFFCLGVSSVGMKPADYRRVTYDLTLAVAEKLREVCGSELRFVYVSGAGTDPHGRAGWARVKGALENALLGKFPEAVMFRPGVIQPLDGARSKTPWVDRLYRLLAPVIGAARRRWPDAVTDTRQIGQAMLNVAARTLPPGLARVRVYEMRDIRSAAAWQPI